MQPVQPMSTAEFDVLCIFSCVLILVPTFFMVRDMFAFMRSLRQEDKQKGETR